MNYPRRGNIYWVSLDPPIGSEIKKTRPAVVVSNDAANEVSSRVIIAPIIGKSTYIFPFEVGISLGGKKGKILLDQVRSIDKNRLGALIAYGDSTTIDHMDEALRIVLGLSYL